MKHRFLFLLLIISSAASGQSPKGIKVKLLSTNGQTKTYAVSFATGDIALYNGKSAGI